MFIDVSKKIKKLEEEIIKEYIKKGEYPSLNKVNKHISDINPFKPLYNPYTMKEGEFLDADILNKEQEQIQEDLRILYESVYEISINEYIRLRTYIQSQIEELHRITKQYTNRASILSNFNKIGKTLFYKDKELPIVNKSDHYEIKLEDIKYMPNSYVSVIIGSINIEEDELYIQIGEHRIKPYNINKDTLFIPYINKEINEHSFKLDDNAKMYCPVQIPIKGDNKRELEVSKKNKYIVSTGKNQALITQENEQRLVDINKLEFEEESIVEFYVINGQNLNIRSNKEFQYSNFNQSEEKIMINNHVRKIKIITYPNTIIKIDNFDGDIYAIRSEGVVLNNNLYYNEYLHNKKFYIEEYLESERVNLPTKVIIYPNLETSPRIDSIEIKESLNIGGDIYD